MELEELSGAEYLADLQLATEHSEQKEEQLPVDLAGSAPEIAWSESLGMESWGLDLVELESVGMESAEKDFAVMDSAMLDFVGLVFVGSVLVFPELEGQAVLKFAALELERAHHPDHGQQAPAAKENSLAVQVAATKGAVQVAATKGAVQVAATKGAEQQQTALQAAGG